MMEKMLKELTECEGIVIVGFPRDVIQAQTFEERVSCCNYFLVLFTNKYKALIHEDNSGFIV